MLARAVACLAALVVGSGAARAAEQTLRLDPAATTIAFVLGATLHEADGSVKLAGGTLTFDADAGTAAGEIAVDATSATTDLSSRDAKMHAEVLESARFPRIAFRPSAIVVGRRDATTADVELRGVLDLHGESRPFVVPAHLVAKDGRLAIESRFRVPYVDWGMRDVSNLILRVDRFVDVTVRSEGTLGTP